MITMILLLFLFVVFLWPLARYSGFAVSNHRAGFLADIRQRLGGLGGPIFRGVVTAMMAEMIAVPMYPLGWIRKIRRDGDGVPVIFVHGLFHNASAWIVMMKRLERAGFHNLHTYQYDSFTRDFAHATDGLERKLDEVLFGRPDGKVILIGHSLGGLVCRFVAGDARFRDHVVGLVALGSPHNGSEMALFGGNRMSRGLIPGRSIPKSVAAVPDPACPKLAIYTLVDDFVFPLNMLQPGRPGWEERICSPMGHVWMLYSREVTGMVVDFLRRIVG